LGPNGVWLTGIGRWWVGSLLAAPGQKFLRKPLRHNVLCRRISGRFFGDNLRVGWVRYGLDSVREADANADCGVMGGGRQHRWSCRGSVRIVSVNEPAEANERSARRQGDRRSVAFPAPEGESRPGVALGSHKMLTGRSSFFETRNSTYRLAQKRSGLLTRQCRDRYRLRPKSSHRKGLELAKAMPSNSLRIEKKRVLLRRGFLSESGFAIVMRSSLGRFCVSSFEAAERKISANIRHA